MHQSSYEAIFQKHFPFWGNLSAQDRDLFCQNTASLSYPKGTILHDSNECTGVFLVESGCLRVYLLSDEGKEVTLYRLFAGDMCMLSASCVIQSITFDVFVSAEEDSRCCQVSGAAFSAVSERNADVKIFALETAVSRFSDVMWVMQQVMFMSLDKRLAIFLLDECSKTQSDTIALTQEQIARYMNSAREAVSRMLKYFSAEGITVVSRKDIRILDKAKLRKLAL